MNAACSIPDAGCAERPRVLLAEDYPAMLALTAEALAGECCVVGSVGDGRDPEYVRTALHAGDTAYVVKPCPASDLMTTVHEALTVTFREQNNQTLGNQKCSNR